MGCEKGKGRGRGRGMGTWLGGKNSALFCMTTPYIFFFKINTALFSSSVKKTEVEFKPRNNAAVKSKNAVLHPGSHCSISHAKYLRGLKHTQENASCQI